MGFLAVFRGNWGRVQSTLLQKRPGWQCPLFCSPSIPLAVAPHISWGWREAPPGRGKGGEGHWRNCSACGCERTSSSCGFLGCFGRRLSGSRGSEAFRSGWRCWLFWEGWEGRRLEVLRASVELMVASATVDFSVVSGGGGWEESKALCFRKGLAGNGGSFAISPLIVAPAAPGASGRPLLGQVGDSHWRRR